MDTKLNNKSEKTTATLEHSFPLFKENAHIPLVQVKMKVDYDPNSNESKAVGLALYCHITKKTLDMTPFMGQDFFEGIIAQEMAVTDWKSAHIATMTQEYFEKIRVGDNDVHGIGEEAFVFGNNYSLNDDPGHEEYLNEQRQNS